MLLTNIVNTMDVKGSLHIPHRPTWETTNDRTAPPKLAAPCVMSDQCQFFFQSRTACTHCSYWPIPQAGQLLLSTSRSYWNTSLLRFWSLPTSSPTFDFKEAPSWPFKRPLKPTPWYFSRTPTCAPSMPIVSHSCPMTSSSLVVFVVNVHKFNAFGAATLIFSCNWPPKKTQFTY
jgi:hypothetical protein